MSIIDNLRSTRIGGIIVGYMDDETGLSTIQLMPEFSTILYTTYINNIKSDMRMVEGIDPERLCSSMVPSDAILSGSAALKAVRRAITTKDFDFFVRKVKVERKNVSPLSIPTPSIPPYTPYPSLASIPPYTPIPSIPPHTPAISVPSLFSYASTLSPLSLAGLAFTPLEDYLWEVSSRMCKCEGKAVECHFIHGSQAKFTEDYDEDIRKRIRIIEINNYTISGVVFQVVAVEGDPKEIITQQFDYGILKNTFDGRNLVITRPREVVEGKCLLENYQYASIFHGLDRALKYKAKGLSVDTSKMPVKPKGFLHHLGGISYMRLLGIGLISFEGEVDGKKVASALDALSFDLDAKELPRQYLASSVDVKCNEPWFSHIESGRKTYLVTLETGNWKWLWREWKITFHCNNRSVTVEVIRKYNRSLDSVFEGGIVEFVYPGVTDEKTAKRMLLEEMNEEDARGFGVLVFYIKRI